MPRPKQSRRNPPRRAAAASAVGAPAGPPAGPPQRVLPRRAVRARGRQIPAEESIDARQQRAVASAKAKRARSVRAAREEGGEPAPADSFPLFDNRAPEEALPRAINARHTALRRLVELGAHLRGLVLRVITPAHFKRSLKPEAALRATVAGADPDTKQHKEASYALWIKKTLQDVIDSKLCGVADENVATDWLRVFLLSGGDGTAVYSMDPNITVFLLFQMRQPGLFQRDVAGRWMVPPVHPDAHYAEDYGRDELELVAIGTLGTDTEYSPARPIRGDIGQNTQFAYGTRANPHAATMTALRQGRLARIELICAGTSRRPPTPRGSTADEERNMGASVTTARTLLAYILVTVLRSKRKGIPAPRSGFKWSAVISESVLGAARVRGGPRVRASKSLFLRAGMTKIKRYIQRGAEHIDVEGAEVSLLNSDSAYYTLGGEAALQQAILNLVPRSLGQSVGNATFVPGVCPAQSRQGKTYCV